MILEVERVSSRSSIAWLLAGVLVLALATWLWTPDKPRVELEAKYAGPPSRFLQVAGLRLHVRVTGPADGPAIVLLHGLGSSLHTWDDWARELDGFRVVRLDLPGFGLTGPDPTGDYSDARSVQVLLALLDALEIPRASLLGHSMGGRIAWQFAAAHPERVQRLVLVSPDGFASPGFEYNRKPEVPAIARLMTRVLPRFLLRLNLAPAFANPTLIGEGLLDRYYDLLRAPGVRQAILDRTAQTLLQDPLPILARIRAPTLLLWGAQDAMIPIANAADYVRALPNSRLVTLPGVGHLPQEEAARESLRPVREFLAGGS